MAKLDLKTTSMIQLVLQVNGRARPDDLQGMSVQSASEALHAYHAIHSTTEPMYFEGDALVAGPSTTSAVAPFAAAQSPADFGAPVTDFGVPAAVAAPGISVPEVFPTAPVVPDFGANADTTPGIVDFGMPTPAPVPAAAPAPVPAVTPAPDFGMPAPVPSAFETAAAPGASLDFSEIPPAPPVTEPSEEPRGSGNRLLLLLVLLVVVLLAAVLAMGWAGMIDLPFGLFAQDQGAGPLKPAAVPTSTVPAAQGASASVPATK